ncbi:MAG: site-2 protease family protein, partial [Acholeplasmataceae bacterium]
MLKRFRWLLWLAFAFVLGFIFSFLVYNGYWYRLIDGLKTLRWYHFFMWLILTFLITLIIHELGHLFAFVFQGVKIRALYLYMLIVYKTKKGWRIKLKPKLWFLLGGFVVPDLDDIVSDENYE